MPTKTAAALILAAGLSTRMEGFKPLLRIGSKRLIEHAIALFDACGIPSVTVVGHRSSELVPAINQTSSRIVYNRHYRDGMFSSIQCGVKELSTYQAFFLLPVDIPLVRPDTIEKLLAARENNENMLVYYPEFHSRKGHPPLISTRLIPEILGYDGPGGMRGLLHKCANSSMAVMVDDQFVTRDADTREDLSYLQQQFQRRIAARSCTP